MNFIRLIFLLLIFTSLKAQTVDEIIAKFEKRSHTFGSTTLPYRLFIPKNYSPMQSYPLVLCLHGAGERGVDNESHIRLHRLATSWADTINQSKWPCFVVAPQCPANNQWVDTDWSLGNYNSDVVPISNEMLTVVNLLDNLENEFAIDTNRLYVTGLSMGGYGTWDLIVRYPNRFAAAIPMSGAGDSSKVSIFNHVPVWNFHGAIDNTVNVKFSRNMNSAYVNRGYFVVNTANLSSAALDYFLNKGEKHIYTEYPNGGHVVWAESYDNPKLFPWVFSQKKKSGKD